jgi:hypothetical protein
LYFSLFFSTTSNLAFLTTAPPFFLAFVFLVKPFASSFSAICQVESYNEVKVKYGNDKTKYKSFDEIKRIKFVVSDQIAIFAL